MNLYHFYEIIAGELYGIDPNDLWTRSRKKPLVIYRQLMMHYRSKILKMGPVEAASRYDKDHSTCNHASKTILNYIQTDKQFRILYNKFVIRCLSERKVRDPNTDDYVGILVDESGLGIEIKQMFENMDTLRIDVGMCLNGNIKPEAIHRKLDQCDNNITRLKEIFGYGTNDTRDMGEG